MFFLISLTVPLVNLFLGLEIYLNNHNDPVIVKAQIVPVVLVDNVNFYDFAAKSYILTQNMWNKNNLNIHNTVNSKIIIRLKQADKNENVIITEVTEEKN